MEGNGIKYINLLAELYSIPQAKLDKMMENADRLDNALKEWLWIDVERQVSCYYAYKSDKTYPKIAQIVALLRADKESHTVNPEEIYTGIIAEPHTEIVQIQRVYKDCVRWLHVNGIVFNDYFGKVKGERYGQGSVLKEQTLPNGQKTYSIWHRKWEIEDAINEARRAFPNVFKPFNKLRFTEDFAFAVQLGVFTI